MTILINNYDDLFAITYQMVMAVLQASSGRPCPPFTSQSWNSSFPNEDSTTKVL